MPAPRSSRSDSDITFTVTRKANFYYGVVHRPGGMLRYGELARRGAPIHLRGALLDKVVMTDGESGASAECYALEPPLGTYMLQKGVAQRVKDYPVVKPGTYDVVYNLATTSPGPPATSAELAKDRHGHRTFWIKAGSDTLFHYGSLPEWTDGCVTVGQKPQLIVQQGSAGVPGHTAPPEYDHLVKGGPNPALPAPGSQTEDNQQTLLSVARMTVRLRDNEAALGAMLRIYDAWTERTGREPRMRAVVTSPDKVPHYDLNDPLQCPMGRDLSF